MRNSRSTWLCWAQSSQVEAFALAVLPLPRPIYILGSEKTAASSPMSSDTMVQLHTDKELRVSNNERAEIKPAMDSVLEDDLYTVY